MFSVKLLGYFDKKYKVFHQFFLPASIHTHLLIVICQKLSVNTACGFGGVFLNISFVIYDI